MLVCAYHKYSDAIALYLKLDGYICTNTYKYKSTTSPHFDTKNKANKEGNPKYAEYSHCGQWEVPLSKKLLPTFKSKNISVYYEIEIVLVELKNKFVSRNKVEIRGNNLDCESDVDISLCDNTKYEELKKVLCKNALEKYKVEETPRETKNNFSLQETCDAVYKVQNNAIVKHEINISEKLENVKIQKKEEINEKDLCVDKIEFEEVFKDVFFDAPNCIEISKEMATMKIRNNEDIVAMLKMPEIFHQDDEFTLYYKNNINWTTINIIKQDYIENVLIDAELIHCDKFYSKNALERVFSFKLESNTFNIKCDKFERKLILIITLDELEVSMDINVANNKAIVRYV